MFEIKCRVVPDINLQEIRDCLFPAVSHSPNEPNIQQIKLSIF